MDRTKKEIIKVILDEYREYMEEMTLNEVRQEHCKYFGLTDYEKGE